MTTFCIILWFIFYSCNDTRPAYYVCIYRGILSCRHSCHGKRVTAASWVPGSEQLNNLNNFLLFINSKNLREGIRRECVYTHMYIGTVFSCTGCSAEEGNAWTEGTRELGTGNSNRMGGSKSKTLEHSKLEHSKKAPDWMGTRELDSGERKADAYTLKH